MSESKPISIGQWLLSWSLLATILAVTGFALLVSRFGWQLYLEIFSHFQVQYLILVLLLAIALGFTGRRMFILVGLFCVAILGSQILPWYFPPPDFLGNSNRDLRILVANVNTQNREFSQVIALTRREKPGLAVFIEVDKSWLEQLDSLRDLLPYSFGEANPYNLGIVVFSQYPLINPQVEFFGTTQNASITGQVVIANQTLSFVAAHPPPPLKANFFGDRNQQLDAIGQYLKTVEEPKLVMGDLNITMWSPYYRRLIKRTGLKNARQGFGILPSWPTQRTYHQVPAAISSFLLIPIDHCLVSSGIKVTQIQTGAEIGSDHLPLLVDLKLLP
ncbi:MAG: endonuclease/exonuclease/phosphatase family protein [Chloroflexaceae bacterium]|nr:endonuclease/exonuclease/phosphatase family protein [Chloroflexaceae bacterium]